MYYILHGFLWISSILKSGILQPVAGALLVLHEYQSKVIVLYSRKFWRTISFAVFMDFTSTTKIISSKFLPGHAACL